MSYHDREQLRQALLELHYDLLDGAEAEALRDAIDNDVEVAAEWQSIQNLAERISDAARLPSLELSDSAFQRPVTRDGAGEQEQRPARPTSVLSQRSLPERSGDHHRPAITDTSESGASESSWIEPGETPRRWSWVRPAVVTALAAMLGMFLIGSWYWARLGQTPPAVVRLQARQVPGHLASSDHEFQVITSRIDRAPSAGRLPVTPAALSFSVFARETVLFSGTARTDASGAVKIALPQDLVVPPQATLQVTASPVEGSVQPSSLEVPLEPTRCVTYLTADRPIYRPGETIWFRSLTLLRRSLRARSEFPVRFELRGPDGGVVTGAVLEGVTERGVGNGSFLIPADAKPGAYTLVAKSLDGVFPDASFELQVRAYLVPRFNKRLRLDGRNYAPGDTVAAEFSVSHVSGAPLVDARLRFRAVVDDQVIHESTSTTTSDGIGKVMFSLPTSINQGSGQLQVVVEHQGTRESEWVPIPIQTGDVSVEFFPEGGYLVGGLENRVYFTARDSRGGPVSLQGELIDAAGNQVVEVVTTHDGRGRFSFQPQAGQAYRLRIERPTGNSQTPVLPEVSDPLPVIDTGGGVFGADQPVRLSVRVHEPQAMLLRATCRGQVVGQRRVELRAGENPLELPVQDGVGGVLRVTLLDPQVRPERPLVERLVYRRPRRGLTIEVQEDLVAKPRSPGERVTLTLQVRDETGEPAAAVLGVAVVDEAAWSLDRGERPSLSTQFLLLSEIESPQQLEDADIYLSDDPDAARSLDLLLGTQGWRRFVSPVAIEANSHYREQLIRLLELDGDPTVAAQPFDNVGRYASAWDRYQQIAEDAWRGMLTQLRMFAVGLLLLWLALYLVQRRRKPSAAAGCLLLAFSSLFIDGCGQSPNGMVVQSSATDAAAQEQHRSSGKQAAVTAPRPMPLSSEAALDPEVTLAPESALSVEASRMANVDRSLLETSPQWVDWLDEAKVAWLLRLSETTAAAARADDEGVGASDAITADQLRRLMKARGLDAEAFAEELLRELQFPIRQYAHQRPPEADPASSDPASRDLASRDLAETLVWHPLLITDAEGLATIEFDLPDSETTFRVQVDGHSEGGRLGSARSSLRTMSER